MTYSSDSASHLIAPVPGRIYADNAASAVIRPEAIAAMEDARSATRGAGLNPAGQYATGRAARRLLEESRETIAAALGCDPIEVVFTASGTEADNLAIQGLAFQARRDDASRRRLFASSVEHPGVAEPVAWLASGLFGFEAQYLPVTPGTCRIDPETLQAALTPDVAAETAAVTVMSANNETGVIQPVHELVEITRAADSTIGFHVDAVQAVGHIPVDFHDLGADTLAASAHKFGGPRGAGLLLVRRQARLAVPLRGGGQERGLRPGTVDPIAAAGTAAALVASLQNIEEETARIRQCRDILMAAVRSIEDVRVWTHEPALPGHVHASFPGAEGDSLIMLLDAAGVDASTGSACSAGVNRASAVLTAMGVDVAVARGALRLSVGPHVSVEEATRIAELLPRVVAQARAAGMA